MDKGADELPWFVQDLSLSQLRDLYIKKRQEEIIVLEDRVTMLKTEVGDTAWLFPTEPELAEKVREYFKASNELSVFCTCYPEI